MYSGFFVTDTSSMFCEKKWFALALIGLLSTISIAAPAPMYAVTDIARVVAETMSHKAEEKAREKANRPPPPPRPQSPPRESDEKGDRAEKKFGMRRKERYILNS